MEMFLFTKMGYYGGCKMINPQDINLKELENKYMRRCLLCLDEYCTNPKHIPSWVLHYEYIKKIISDRIEKEIDIIIINRQSP